ncbi:MAG: hypothetical protein WC980_04950 [Candidatus Brocadiia bacterium]
MKIRYIIIIIVALCLLQIPVLKSIEATPERQEIIKSNPFNSLPPTDYLGTYMANTMLGGFKPLLVDYLWLKTENLQKDKQYETVLTLLTIIAKLQPHLTAVWSYNAYHMIYNMSNQEKTPEGKWLTVKNGLEYIHKGMSYNPENSSLTGYLAFFYYHRIPQDRFLMDMVAKEEGKSTYLMAAKWYYKTMELYQAKGSTGFAYDCEIMFLASRYFYAFELLDQRRFDEALSEISSFRQYIEKDLIPRSGPDYSRWTTELQGYDQIISIIKAEKALFESDGANPGPLLDMYGNLINTHVGLEFMPIYKHIDAIFSAYLKKVYGLIDQSRPKDAQQLFLILADRFRKSTPKLDDHPSSWYFLAFNQRIAELEDILISEAKGEPKDKIAAAYELYIKKYGKVFLTEEEKSRLAKITRTK